MRSILLTIGVAALLAAGAAEAKPAPRAKLPPSIDNVYWMVDCAIAKKSRELEKTLSTIPAGPRGFEKHWFKAVLYECLPDDRPIPAAGVYKRGAVAERFLYRDFESIGAAPRRPPAAVFAPVTADDLAKEPSSVLALAMLDAMSCLVRGNPGQAYGFFRLKRDSAEERARMLEMVPGLSQCLTEGVPIELTPAIFRAFLAEAAYRAAAGQPEVFGGRP